MGRCCARRISRRRPACRSLGIRAKEVASLGGGRVAHIWVLTCSRRNDLPRHAACTRRPGATAVHEIGVTPSELTGRSSTPSITPSPTRRTSSNSWTMLVAARRACVHATPSRALRWTTLASPYDAAQDYIDAALEMGGAEQPRRAARRRAASALLPLAAPREPSRSASSSTPSCGARRAAPAARGRHADRRAGGGGRADVHALRRAPRHRECRALSRRGPSRRDEERGAVRHGAVQRDAVPCNGPRPALELASLLHARGDTGAARAGRLQEYSSAVVASGAAAGGASGAAALLHAGDARARA